MATIIFGIYGGVIEMRSQDETGWSAQSYVLFSIIPISGPCWSKAGTALTKISATIIKKGEKTKNVFLLTDI
jgi:hypothetical protein